MRLVPARWAVRGARHDWTPTPGCCIPGTGLVAEAPAARSPMALPEPDRRSIRASISTALQQSAGCATAQTTRLADELGAHGATPAAQSAPGTDSASRIAHEPFIRARLCAWP